MDGKVRIRILDDTIEVPPGDSILRALQIYGILRKLPAYGFTRFCWNAKCKQCILRFSCDGVRERDFACQTEARDGMQVHTLPDVLKWKLKISKR
jgi:NADH dehydrogenase/NADH:ubiquinone oxidoreductase subunit G